MSIMLFFSTVSRVIIPALFPAPSLFQYIMISSSKISLLICQSSKPRPLFTGVKHLVEWFNRLGPKRLNINPSTILQPLQSGNVEEIFWSLAASDVKIASMEVHKFSSVSCIYSKIFRILLYQIPGLWVVAEIGVFTR